MAVKSDVKRTRRKASQSIRVCIKEERNASFKKISSILQKAEIDRTEEEKEVLFNCSDLVQEVTRRIEKRRRIKERLQEVEDPPGVLAEKCVTLAEALSNSSQLVVYTGAGISTAACIPDYRGKNGIWTLLQQGKDIGLHDLTQAEPTLTHMALSQLYYSGLLKYVVSQNCDGLHLRSGLPRHALSEVHGNMYIEVCRNCKPTREYLRLFDVTENTARYSHRTMRHCYACDNPLVDTIVHFGERGTLKWPLNWPAACEAADKADVILCIGSSLKVLKKYPWLWGMDKPVKKRPKLYIVNLQWTPKDDQAVLKISGKCDVVMQQVMAHLKMKIPFYDRVRDPIFPHATVLHPAEEHTTTKPILRSVSVDTPDPFNRNKPDTETDKSKWSNMPFMQNLCKKEDADLKNTLSSSVVVVRVEGEAKNRTVKSESNQEIQDYLSPVMEIVYEGVKLKVEGNVSVEASVKIDDDLAIFCDSSKIDQNSFMSSYKLEHDQQSFHFVSVGTDDVECNEVDSEIGHIEDPFGDGALNDSKCVIPCSNDPLVMNCSGRVQTIKDSSSNNVCETNMVCDDQSSICIRNNSKFICNLDVEKVKGSGNHTHTEVSNKLYSFSDCLERSYFNSITNLGCDIGISSSTVANSSESVVSISSPIVSSSLPAMFQIEHNYSKTSPSDQDVPKTEICLPSDSLSCNAEGSRTKVSPDKCSTNALSSFKVTTPESTKDVLCGTEQSNKQSCDDASAVGYAKKCSFCKLNYNSDNCLFYRPFDAVFSKPSSSICECCGEDEDGDDEQSEEEKDESCNKEMSEGDTENSVAKTSVINPGWYGKGYRKRLKRRRCIYYDFYIDQLVPSWDKSILSFTVIYHKYPSQYSISVVQYFRLKDYVK